MRRGQSKADTPGLIPSVPLAPRGRSWRFGIWVIVVVLSGWLIVSHGCHRGDHDDELVIGRVDRKR